MQLRLPLGFLLLEERHDVAVEVKLAMIQLWGILRRHVNMNTRVVLAIPGNSSWLASFGRILHFKYEQLSINLSDFFPGLLLALLDPLLCIPDPLVTLPDLALYLIECLLDLPALLHSLPGLLSRHLLCPRLRPDPLSLQLHLGLLLASLSNLSFHHLNPP